MKKAKGFFEKPIRGDSWPFALIYAPLGPLWLWYAVKAKAFCRFSPANSTLTFAGFDGESKREMWAQLPPALYPRTVYINPASTVDEAKKNLREKSFAYAHCIKPDAGL